MKICIFGADGRTGSEIVKYAKSKGYEITAFVYTGSILSFSSNDIKIIEGDVLDYHQVLLACTDVDVIVSALGHVQGSDPRMQTKGIINIVRAMKEINLTRIISLTGTGVRVQGDTPSTIDKILNYLVTLLDRNRMVDGIEHAKVLQQSGLDWTIVRVLKLNSSQKSIKNYTLTSGGPAELLTSRKKVSKVMVDLIEDPRYSNTLPVVSV